MRRPETVGELMQFLQSANWMRTHLPQFAEAKAPLQALLDGRLPGTRRTRQVATRRPLTEQDWDDDRINAWETLRRLLKELVQLSYPKPGWRVLMFPGASNLFWGCCVTQVSAVDFHSGMEVMDMPREPLGFVSGAFRGSQLN